MKNIILLFTFFLIFSKSIYGYDIYKIGEELGIQKIEKKYLREDYFYLIEDYRLNKDNIKLLNYINKVGFYDCNIFKELEQTYTRNIFLESCEFLINDYKKEHALNHINDNIESLKVDNDIYNSYLTLLFSLNNNEKKVKEYLLKLESNNKINILKEYFKVINGLKYNEKLLLNENYNYKVYYLYNYLKEKKENKKFDIDFLSKVNFALEHENIFYKGVRHDFIIGSDQYFYLLLNNYYDFNKEKLKSLYYNLKNIDFLDTFEASSIKGIKEAKEKSYYYYLSYLVNYDNFSQEDMLNSLYGEFVNILKEDDRNLVQNFIKIYSENKKSNEFIENGLLEEYINLLYCNDKISEYLKNRKFLTYILGIINNISKEDLYSLNICIEANEKIFKILENNNIIENTDINEVNNNNLKNYYYLIFLIIILLLFIIYYRRKNA